MNGKAPANGASGSKEWWLLPPPPLPVTRRSRDRLRKYVIPSGRSQRALAVLRRARVFKARSKKRHLCHMCWHWRALGRAWAPPGKEEKLWYCQPCWTRWRVAVKQWFVSERSTWDDWDLRPKRRRKPEATGVEEPQSPAPPSSPLLKGRPDPDDGEPEHFDFVEVGTSNYHTFTQAVAGHPDGKPYAWRFLPWDVHPLRLRGLAVDMKQDYLDQLPDLPRVEKVQAAVSESGGMQRMYHVPLGDIEHFEAVFAARGSWRGHRAMQLARGCSALGQHSMLRRLLAAIGLRHLARVRRVCSRNLASVLEGRRVGSIGMLALDCEGHDCAILRGLLKSCETQPHLYPSWIWFESNGMNDELFGPGTESDTVWHLEGHGYRVLWGGGYDRTGKRDTLLERTWCWKEARRR